MPEDHFQHYLLPVEQWLNNRFHNEWIGRSEAIEWPLLSPKMTIIRKHRNSGRFFWNFSEEFESTLITVYKIMDKLSIIKRFL